MAMTALKFRAHSKQSRYVAGAAFAVAAWSAFPDAGLASVCISDNPIFLRKTDECPCSRRLKLVLTLSAPVPTLSVIDLRRYRGMIIFSMGYSTPTAGLIDVSTRPLHRSKTIFPNKLAPVTIPVQPIHVA